MMYSLVLVCAMVVLSKSMVVMSGVASPSPWPTLTPTPQPAKPQSFDNGQAVAQLALTMEEEMLVDMLPFKPPFAMDKKQMAVIIRLLKKAVKPVLKSERLRTMVSSVDDFMQDLNNQENKKYYGGMLDVAQYVYKKLNQMYSDDEFVVGRQFYYVPAMFSLLSEQYRQSILHNWVIIPITSRISSAVYDTILPQSLVDILPEALLDIDTYDNIEDKIDTVNIETLNIETDIIETDNIETDNSDIISRWSETFSLVVSQFSLWSERASNFMLATALFLEELEKKK